MKAFLVADEGPLAGLNIALEEGNEWIIGRDPDTCSHTINDPMIASKHVMITLKEQTFFLENLSAVSPAEINGETVTAPTALKESDTVQMGSSFLRFTLIDPSLLNEQNQHSDNATPTIYEESIESDTLSFSSASLSRWMIKVISGPNSGAEFSVHEDTTYTLGKDPKKCDFVFQDLSVSRKHAKITLTSDDTIEIEDLNSLNKVLVNGKAIEKTAHVKNQDLVTIGTTSFLVIDQEATRETIVSPVKLAMQFNNSSADNDSDEDDLSNELTKKTWKNMKIPTRHLVTASIFLLLLLMTVGGTFSLFSSKSIEITHADPAKLIDGVLKKFPEVEFSYLEKTGNLFLLGHVFTEIDHQELIYAIKSISRVKNVEDNVIIDELVWENTNALLFKNMAWRGVSLSSTIPGQFVLRGYVQTLPDSTKLSDYINNNFPYLDRIHNQVVVENTLEAQIQTILMQNELSVVKFQLANGELILSGRLGSNYESKVTKSISTISKLNGIRIVKNFVVMTKPGAQYINLSAKYKITGTSKQGKINKYVVIGGKILSVGELLDGMSISKIEENAILLEKDGLKYRINYNQG
ncbi:EscD/YscD/HrpQ family type III secretion system inner membrane ring protein [Candidatus Aerophobetes bacterium]|uniref:EscD/YscD/HrpQ family type III secretion system inner membrane ring protein n=1 Tax=Aerophobetes bacterium TaxID=2030807 RepID=A0A2A4X631_UNCAE|nr:MAG: EscD/YscD/HrpQ family type III secretion system inner membrane ring protein [Candidatus Aerophobetes bacterium]